MSWGMDFDAEVYLSREIYRSEGEVKEKIDEVNKEIARNRARISMLVSANPKSFIPDNCESSSDILYELDNIINDILDDISEEIKHKTLLELLLDNWKDEYGKQEV